MAKYVPTMKRDQAKRIIARVLQANTLAESAKVLENAAKRTKGAWRENLRKLSNGLKAVADNRSTKAPYRVFIKGNSKLPFYGFSTLPQYTCPGAGACLEFCYSFTAWRYPAALCRQLQNTLLLKFAKRIVESEYNRLKDGATLRLYVDGDIDSLATLGFWFRLLNSRPSIQAYGYSKSWPLFEQWNAQGLPWPVNYKLNLSSGGKHDADNSLQAIVASLPVTRGRFVTVSDIGPQVKGFARFNDDKYHLAVRNAARQEYDTKRVFSCPGKCGACLPSGEHACGSDKMHNVLIAIGEHN